MSSARRSNRFASAGRWLVGAMLLGCSSIPDIQFEDVDAGGEGTSSRDGGSANDGGGQASEDGGETNSRDWSCPDRPPPSGRGVCCGSTLCLRCTEANCDRCLKQDCNRNQVCCGRTSGSSTATDCQLQLLCR